MRTEAILLIRCNCFEMWWPGTELNRRRQPFQGCALPPELPGHIFYRSTADACELWATPTLAKLPVIAGGQMPGARATAPIITTKVDSLNAKGRVIDKAVAFAHCSWLNIGAGVSAYPSHSPTELP
jgi:hypothetical protein